MVSLIDSRRQYILAEATRTVSLFSAAAERPEDEVWLGNAILNKTDAVCYHTFTATYGAKEDHGGTYDAACMVVPDCRLDPRFADKDYVTGEPGVRFYAGVPIITKAGHHIGVYAVSDEKPRDGLSAAEVRFMQDVAAAVMEHLELAKDSDDRIKGERMVCGLTDFIERSAQDMRGYSATKQTTMERQTENARAAAADDDGESAAPPPPPTTKQAQRTRASESDPARIFQRAARIVRESTDADGVVFFDSSAAGIKFNHIHDSPAASSDESAAPTNTTDFDTGDSASSRRRRKRLVVSESPTAHASSQDRPCPVAGLSLRQGKGAVAHADFAFTESAMERYIRKYPVGKFFCYLEQGVGLNSSDERSQVSETEQSDHTIFVTPGTQVKSRRKRTEKLIPTEFLKILPDVRTLIFLPLWDPASEIWIAGGFIWTTNASRLMSPEHELPYLQAFGNSITSEVARIGAQKADKAKTTFIASISHELRSPLHGILGSVEFLRDTVSSAYQESLVSSIETCGRTLLDTIDHVLDYAKINKLQSLASRKKGIGGRSKAAIAENTVLGVTIDFDLAQLVEEVCDTVCAGHTFRKTHNPSGGAFYDQAENKNVHQSDHKGPVEEGRDTHGSVLVSLIVAPYVTWVVRSQAGALRRIVMNLLGTWPS
jgi:signal transduction histidine kinase